MSDKPADRQDLVTYYVAQWHSGDSDNAFHSLIEIVPPLARMNLPEIERLRLQAPPCWLRWAYEG